MGRSKFHFRFVIPVVLFLMLITLNLLLVPVVSAEQKEKYTIDGNALFSSDAKIIIYTGVCTYVVYDNKNDDCKITKVDWSFCDHYSNFCADSGSWYSTADHGEVHAEACLWVTGGCSSCPHGQADVTYSCDAPKPAPPAPPLPPKEECTKKLWCFDADLDGMPSDSYKFACDKPTDYSYLIGGIDNGDGSWECDLDNCPDKPNPAQSDTDKDGTGNACDNCPTSANKYQNDTDKDGIGNVCDVCPDNPDTKAQKWDYFLDNDKDGVPDLATKNKPKSSCPPAPAGYVAYKGTWDICDDTKAIWWYWDQDKDNHGNPTVQEKACTSPKKKNDKGHWILTPADDECDNDPQAFKKEDWYWDADMDGVGYSGYTDSVNKPRLMSCKLAWAHTEPANVVGKLMLAKRWVTKKNDACDDPKIMGYDKVQKKDEFYLDKDDDGIPSVVNPKKYCTTEEAAQDGYIPKQVDVAPEQLDVPGVKGPKVNLIPTLDTKPSAGIWDCDDNDPEIDSHITVYRDTDEDGFGDPMVTKVVDCGSGHILKDYQQEWGKDGWVINKSDLSDIIWAMNMQHNIEKNAGKLFRITPGEPLIGDVCFNAGPNMLECLAASIFKNLCGGEDEGFVLDNLPTVTSQEQVAGQIVKNFSKNILMDCLAPQNGNIRLIHHGDDLYLMTNFQPLGKIMLAVKGTDYFMLAPTIDLVTSIGYISDLAWPYVAPHVVQSLKDIEGPIPIGAAEEIPYLGPNSGQVEVSRRIVAHGMIGPDLAAKVFAQEIKNNSLIFTDLFANPLIYAFEEAKEKLIPTLDQDADYLFDILEEKHGSDPENEDSDGDGFDDAAEFLWAGHRAEAALNPQVKPEVSETFLDDEKLHNFIGVDVPATPYQEIIFAQAKQKAAELVPAMMARLHDLYGQQSSMVVINKNIDIVSLIGHAKNATRLDLYEYQLKVWSESVSLSENERENISPFIYVSGFLYGIASGCGPDGKDICVDLNNMKMSGSQISEPKLVNTLLHEALHHVITIKWFDPYFKAEHQVIYDTIGQTDFNNLL